MNKSNQKTTILISGVIVAALAFGSIALMNTYNVKAADEGITPTPQSPNPQDGKGGFRGNPANEQKYLAEALGITEDELTAAQQTATEAAITEAVEQGIITQEQADKMLNNENGLPGIGFLRRGRPGESQTENTIDYDALLADALGITTDELKTARETARDNMQAEAIANGDISQDQEDLIKIRQALSSYIHPEELQAEALGITTDELKAYREARTSMAEILSAVGMTETEYQEALKAAYETALTKAVSDGAITQEQADLYLTNYDKGMPGMGGPGQGGQGQPPNRNNSDTNASGTPQTPGQSGPGGPGGGSGGPGWFGGPGGFGRGPGAPTPTATPES
jgi:hypothetical protein